MEFEGPYSKTIVLDANLCSVVEAMVVETSMSAANSVTLSLVMMVSLVNRLIVSLTDPGFPTSEIYAMKKPGPENKDSSDTENDDDVNEGVDDQDDEGGDNDDASGEEDGEEDAEDDPEANGAGGSEGDDDDDEEDDVEDGEEEDEDEDEEEGEENEEEEIPEPPAKRRK